MLVCLQLLQCQAVGEDPSVTREGRSKKMHGYKSPCTRLNRSYFDNFSGGEGEFNQLL